MRMWSIKMACLFTLLFLSTVGGSPSSTEGALIHQYRLDGSLADDLGGPSLVSLGGSIGPTSYAFGPNQGLALSNAGITTNYTIEMNFRFSDLLGYRRILDFKNLSADSGLYTLNTALNFYPIGSGASGTFAPDQNANVVITRDGSTNQVMAYVNGALHLSFSDGSSLATFTGPNNIMHFFRDDNAVGGEATSGVAEWLRIWDNVLSQEQIGRLGAPQPPQGQVPEPSTLVVFSGFSALGWGLTWFRRRRAPHAN